MNSVPAVNSQAMTKRTFSIHDACAAVGISSVCLHQWIERGHFIPSRDAPAGISREYTLRDVVHIAAIVELTRIGLPVGRAVQILGACPLDTARRRTVVARIGHAEIRLNVTAVAERVRLALV